MRAKWVCAQRLVPLLSRFLIQKHKDFQVLPDGHRIASDGLLERQVGTVGGPKWVPYVPVGHAAATIPWRNWCFLQCHVSVLGGHRLEKQTSEIMSRSVYWEKMTDDIE